MISKLNIIIFKTKCFIQKHETKFSFAQTILFIINNMVDIPILQVIEYLLEHLLM